MFYLIFYQFNIMFISSTMDAIDCNLQSPSSVQPRPRTVAGCGPYLGCRLGVDSSSRGPRPAQLR